MTINYPQRARNRDNSRGKTRDVNAVTRVHTAIQLYAQHLSWDDIAARAGYASRGAAHNAVMREMDRVVVKDIDELRTQELHMLNIMHSEVWDLFMDRKNKGRLFAADRILAISERRSKLLGMDVPVDNAIAANMVIVREVPLGYLGSAPDNVAVEAQQ